MSHSFFTGSQKGKGWMGNKDCGKVRTGERKKGFKRWCMVKDVWHKAFSGTKYVTMTAINLSI